MLLEPFMNAEISVPDHVIGDILADVSGKRGGRVVGIKSVTAKFLNDFEQT